MHICSQSIDVSQFSDIHFPYSLQRGCDIHKEFEPYKHDQDLGILTKESLFNLETFGKRSSCKKIKNKEQG